MNFNYVPLSASQVRLLSLWPCESASGPLVGTLDHVALDRAETYDALSYTWGSIGDMDTMRLGYPSDDTVAPCLIQLTSNLCAALRRLRQPDKLCRLWVDQICINQKDSEEKAIQVPLMGHIYKAADRVVVWLGEEDSDTPLAFQDLGTTPDEMNDLRKWIVSNLSVPLSESEETRLTAVNWPMVKIATPAWKAVSRLFAREYFRRVWIVQEVVLGREVVVSCGSFATLWDDLATVAILHRHLCNEISQDLEYAPDTIVTIDTIRRSYQVYGRKYNFANAVFSSHFLNATDPRDKIYGMLALLERHEPALPVSYKTTVEDVYISATVHYIRQFSSLDVLTSIVGSGSTALPSWVPDCRTETVTRQRIPQSTRSLTCSCAATKTPSISISSDFRELLAAGCILDEIVWTGDGYERSSIVGQDVTLQWMDVAHEVAQARETSSFPLNYHRLLCASDDVAVPGSSTNEREREAFDTWCSMASYFAPQKGKYTGHDGTSALSTIDFETRKHMACLGRRPLVTRRKGLALGPLVSQVGDVICWLHGCSVPMILRRTQKHPDGGDHDIWQVVGPCYFQDHMSGVCAHCGQESRQFIIS